MKSALKGKSDPLLKKTTLSLKPPYPLSAWCTPKGWSITLPPSLMFSMQNIGLNYSSIAHGVVGKAKGSFLLPLTNKIVPSFKSPFHLSA